MVKLNTLFPNSTILIILSTFEDILELDETIVMDSGYLLEHGKTKELILNKASNLNHLIINSDPGDFIDLYAKAGGVEPPATNLEKLHDMEAELEAEEERLIQEERELEEREREFELK